MGTYVVTGGAGFIGSHLVDSLLWQGHNVRVVDDLSTGELGNLPPGAQCVVGDVADQALLRHVFTGADGCFHLAAVANVMLSNEKWVDTHRTNQSGTVAVLQAACNAGRVPVVYASSAAVYGDHGAIRLHEGLPARPISAYGADKFGSELHARVAWLVHQTPSIGLRFFNVFGPRQNAFSPYSGVISIFARRLLAGHELTVFGDGQQTRDFIFVADVVSHLRAAMDFVIDGNEPSAHVLNVCTGLGTSILSLADSLGDIAGRTPRIRFAPARPGDVRASVGNPCAARVRLRTSHSFALADGLSALLGAMEKEESEQV
jgi:UDP-glucose 4-epimerase